MFGLDVNSDPAKENSSRELDLRRGTMAARCELITGNTVEALKEMTSVCSLTQSLSGWRMTNPLGHFKSLLVCIELYIISVEN